MAEFFSVAKAIILPANATQPVELGVLQEVSLDFTIEKKELKGQNRFAILTVQAGGSVSGKASMARINAETLGALLGATKTTGSKLLATHPTTVIPATPFAITVTNSATWTQDGGVILVGTSELYNTPMTKVHSTATPTAGQYKVSAGVYTFAEADASKSVIIDYEYSDATGTTLTLPNPVIGASYPFTLWAKTVIESKQAVIKLPNVISGKLSMPLKLGEFSIPDFDFDVFADGAGNIGYIFQSA
jgi:hypothetical protein